MVSSRVYPGLERKPGGPDNWVEAAGGLPSYIERIAKHLHYEKGMSISRAIAVAVNTVKRWALGGTVTEHGTTKRVTPKTQALAKAAVISWEAKKRAGDLRLSEALLWVIDLADADIEPTSTMVALMLPDGVANKIAVDGGTTPEDMHVTLLFNGELDDAAFQKLVSGVKQVGAGWSDGPLKGSIGGIGTFPADDSRADGGAPWWVPVDVPGINKLYEQLNEAVGHASEHGYTPHSTLTYVKQGETPPDPVPSTPVEFGSMWVVRGGDERVEIPLGKPTGVELTERGTLLSNQIDLSRELMDINELADRAGRISDPTRRADAYRQVLDLASTTPGGPTMKVRKKLAKEGKAIPGASSGGGFPIRNVEELKKAIRAIGRAKDPAKAKRHIVRRARALGASDLIPDQWKVDLVEELLASTIDLASSIPPRKAKGKAKDGRPSYKDQGEWKHGFIPANRAAAEAKAKGSPIAMKRIQRLFGKVKEAEKAAEPKHKAKKRIQAAKGRAGSRSAGGRKANTKDINVDEKAFPGAERVKDIGQLRRTPVADADNRNVFGGGKDAKLPKQQKEASKSSRIPERARQNWDEIPEALKTTRNGKRYVLAEFGGKQFVTEWIGGVSKVTQTALQDRKVMRTLSSADAANMTTAALRALINNQRTSEAVKKTARKALRAKEKAKRVAA